MSYLFVTTCVGAVGSDIQNMLDAAREITVRTFAKHCDYKEASKMCGYTDERGLPFCKGLTLASDYTTSFYKSKYRNKPCYYFEWSGIEHVYTE